MLNPSFSTPSINIRGFTKRLSYTDRPLRHEEVGEEGFRKVPTSSAY